MNGELWKGKIKSVVENQVYNSEENSFTGKKFLVQRQLFLNLACINFHELDKKNCERSKLLPAKDFFL